MNRFVVAAAALMTLAALPATAAPSYGQCREIVAQHSFMLEARTGCNIRLREDTSNLAYSCATKLTDGHRELAFAYGKMMADKYIGTKGGRVCQDLRNDFSPLIRE
jgi:hypothetical protein